MEVRERVEVQGKEGGLLENPTSEEIQAYIIEHCQTCHNFRGWDYEMIMKHGEFKPVDLVLDTGAMHTYFCVYLAQFVTKVHATDSFAWAERAYIHEQGLPTPKAWMQLVEAAGADSIVARKEDVTKLSYGDATFDKVLSISTIEHIAGDTFAMREMMRVLKPGGLLLLTTELGLQHKAYSEKDGSYYRIYDPGNLFQLFNCCDLEVLTQAPHIYTEDTDQTQYVTVFVKVRK